LPFAKSTAPSPVPEMPDASPLNDMSSDTLALSDAAVFTTDASRMLRPFTTGVAVADFDGPLLPHAASVNADATTIAITD
jgi:hypothetical protein